MPSFIIDPRKTHEGRARLVSRSAQDSLQIDDYYEFLDRAKYNFDKLYGKPFDEKVNGIDDFDIIRTVGLGSFSTVVLARSKSEGTFQAIKIMSKEKVLGRNAQKYAVRERHIMRAISFPFIVPLVSSFQDNSNLYLVMPFLNGGDLFNLLKSQQQIDEKVATFYLAQIILCLEYMHCIGLVYRDLKPENILIECIGYVKLGDLGFAKRLDGRTYTFCGTPEYMAPEIVLGKGYGRAVDWWALGVLAFEMVGGRVPFQAKDQVKVLEKIARKKNLVMPTHFSQPFKSFINSLMEMEPTKRLGNLKGGAEDVKQHPWLKSVDWLGILDKNVTPPISPSVKGPGDSTYYDKFDDFVLTFELENKFGSKHFEGF